MEDKKTYFVTVDTEDIREVSIPESGIEYEINATTDEIEELELLFKEKNKNADQAAKYLGKPFNEGSVEVERKAYDDYLVRIFRELYKLGTQETQKRINELNLFE